MAPKLVIDNVGDLDAVEVRRRPGPVVHAAQIPYDFALSTLNDEVLEGAAGDWVVHDPATAMSRILADADFKAAYQRRIHRKSAGA